jgi:3-phosphoshikimate 1-carboxyvinyltransferase
MKRLKVTKSGGLKGVISVPGDKSISHRAVILGSIAGGTTTVRGFLPAEDCLRTAAVFRMMGVAIEQRGDALRIEGRGLRGLAEPSDVLDLGNSGTGMRLLTGLMAGQSFFSVVTGDETLRRRPMRRVVDPLRQMGAVIAGRNGGEFAPLAVTGRPLKGIRYDLPVASAQVKSALLLAGLTAEGPTRLTEPSASRDHTERMLLAFGADLRVEGTTVTVHPAESLKSRDLEIPGDPSSAAFFVVAALIVPGSELTIRSVGVNPTRTGFIDVLHQMGADLRLENRREIGGEPAADLVVRSGPLKGVAVDPALVPRAIDEFPVLAVAAAFAEGETLIRGAEELRVKESDRIAVMAAELRKLGARVEELPDGLRITGGAPLAGAVCESRGDHRVAMAMAVAGLAASGETLIEDAACIETSFPGFESLLRKAAGGRPRGTAERGAVIAIDGPAGSGKSSAARDLAARLGYRYVDTGALYRAVGWKALEEGVNLKNPSAVGKIVRALKIEVKSTPDRLRVWVDGTEVTDRLRTLEVSRAAAAVAMMPAVRRRLLGLQRQIGKAGGVVVEGRDIGTVVFPKADLKFFLDASPEERVRRRWKELSDKGDRSDLRATREEIDIRDLKDSKRAISPLKKADDAVSIDSTVLSLPEVVERILQEVRGRLGIPVRD